MADTDGTTVLTSPGMRWSKAVICGALAIALALVLPEMARRGNPVVFGYMGAVSLAVVVLLVGTARSLRAGIYLGDNRVVVRTPYSTRSWRYDELERAETIDLISRGGPMGLLTITTQRAEPVFQIVPVFRRVGRAPVVVRSLRISTTSPNESNWLDRALEELNRRIEAHRGPAEPR